MTAITINSNIGASVKEIIYFLGINTKIKNKNMEKYKSSIMINFFNNISIKPNRSYVISKSPPIKTNLIIYNCDYM